MHWEGQTTAVILAKAARTAAPPSGAAKKAQSPRDPSGICAELLVDWRAEAASSYRGGQR